MQWLCSVESLAPFKEVLELYLYAPSIDDAMLQIATKDPLMTKTLELSRLLEATAQKLAESGEDGGLEQITQLLNIIGVQ